MNDQSRRKYERYLCDMVVWLRPYDSDEEFILVSVENISSGGILCHTTQTFEHNSLLELQVSILQQEEMVRVKAKVVHTRKLSEEETALGLEFLETDGVSLPTFMVWLEAMFN